MIDRSRTTSVQCAISCAARRQASRKAIQAAIGASLFDQGRGTIARGRALVDDSRARLQSLELSIDTAVRLGIERIRAARSVADDYRSALIPEREAVVARTQETVPSETSRWAGCLPC
jgi:hypothetical protein